MKTIEERIQFYFQSKGELIEKFDNLPQKKLSTPYYKSSIGTYIVNGSPEGCRDRMQNLLEQTNTFAFVCQNVKSTYIFMRLVEKLSHVKLEDLAKFTKTEHKNVILVELSPWWNYRVRRSLFTLLMRCSNFFLNYEKDVAKSFLKAMYSQQYTANTKAAVDKFLKGCTASKIKKNELFSGWANYFTNANNAAKLVKIVKKPEVPVEENNHTEEPVKEVQNV